MRVDSMKNAIITVKFFCLSSFPLQTGSYDFFFHFFLIQVLSVLLTMVIIDVCAVF